MKTRIRTYLALLLALLLVVTGQSLAVTRGSGGPAGQMVLCTGAGPLMVYVDENGAPTGPPVYCPDFGLTLFNAMILADLGATGDITGRASLVMPVAPVRGIVGFGDALARAPPFVV